MKTAHKLIQGLLVLAFAISTPHAFAADKTSSGKLGEEVKTSSDGVKVHEMKTTKQMKEAKQAQKEREAKEKSDAEKKAKEYKEKK